MASTLTNTPRGSPMSRCYSSEPPARHFLPYPQSDAACQVHLWPKVTGLVLCVQAQKKPKPLIKKCEAKKENYQ